MNAANKVFTLGHSDREFDEVLDLLRIHRVTVLVDVRRFPASRTHPQWNQDAIVDALPAELTYAWISELGGRRHTPAGVSSPNGGWRVKAFQDYADHMTSEEFQRGFGLLLELAEGERPALMCSEAVPWRCHRRLITDALLVAGREVVHILTPTRTMPATLTPHARLLDGRLIYPPTEAG